MPPAAAAALAAPAGQWDSGLLGWIGAVAALLVLAALLVSAEVALSWMSPARIGELAASVGREPARLRQISADPPRYLNLLALLRITCQLAAAVLATFVAVRLLGVGWPAFASAAAVMAVVTYVGVEVAPRILARQSAERVALVAAPAVVLLGRLLGPLSQLLVLLGRGLTPRRGHREGPFSSEAELRDLVDLAEQRRFIDADEREMIHSVFELGDTAVREVMVPRTEMVAIERERDLDDALSLALRSGFSRIPVEGENADDIVGILYLKDVVAAMHERPGEAEAEPVERVMRAASYVPDTKPIDGLLREMQAEQTHLAIVIDEYGGTAGLITIEDIIEEIVGEITDEYDNEIAPIEELPGGDARVLARLPLDELADHFGVALRVDDVETVGGLLAYALNRVPIAGSTVTMEGLRFTAETPAGRRNRIRTVLVERDSAGPRP
ncbi:hemolysin family protein [Allonocardiopsis opalescens]|uniref:CBS domain containing-hemolysin-like protein n=1 Tax=Allonocardiopsis opalescens TaxID=1144618 RepID=A0A2T0QFL8_9ACTN|nr:hemolysin family protein [Allonocardiopsis opalescens]PRY02695.1 CBS domain containing-hemolysin-like protein [Allonocardiopsis opalescens]